MPRLRRHRPELCISAAVIAASSLATSPATAEPPATPPSESARFIASEPLEVTVRADPGAPDTFTSSRAASRVDETHIRAVTPGSLADALLPVETALDDIPALAVTRADAARLHRGQAVLLRGRDAPNSSGTVYVTVAGRLLALAEIGNGELIPKRVFNLTGLTASPGRSNERV